MYRYVVGKTHVITFSDALNAKILLTSSDAIYNSRNSKIISPTKIVSFKIIYWHNMTYAFLGSYPVYVVLYQSITLKLTITHLCRRIIFVFPVHICYLYNSDNNVDPDSRQVASCFQ